jgi:hypothetical protein
MLGRLGVECSWLGGLLAAWSSVQADFGSDREFQEP